MHPVEEYQNYNLDRRWVEWVQLWRSQEEGGIELLYNSVKTGSQLVWRLDHLETICGRESQHPAEGALRPPIEQLQLGIRRVTDKMLDWGTCPREARTQAPGWAAQENGKETRLWPIEWGSICCSSVRSPTSSHTQPFQIKWEAYFSKNCIARRYCAVVMFCIQMYMHM